MTRSPLADPRPGDRVVSGDGRWWREALTRSREFVLFCDPNGGNGEWCDTDDWRDWCRRNSARPAAGEGE